MRTEQCFSDGWIFEGIEEVCLPHTAVELPFSYLDEASYQRPFSYEKHFDKDPTWEGQEVFLRLDAAMANARVSLNGVEIAAHADGYTPITARMTDVLVDEGNHLEVIVDGTENPDIPPFGGQIDYLTYAGLYRDAWLIVRPKIAIENLKIEPGSFLDDKQSLELNVFTTRYADSENTPRLFIEVLDANLEPVVAQEVDAAQGLTHCSIENLEDIVLWDVDNPYLYSVRITLKSSAGTDVVEERFGFRSAEFKPDGFYLNGRNLKIRGLNRHQSFPYIGYALGKAAQEKDAEILKNELRLNLVRCSHYPQSKYFLDRCDEIGLLVFEEIPGWQHIGGDAWKSEAIENVRRMIQRDWNHPSIIIWGVRINESQDDGDFYQRTNALARELDPTRQTGGVRYHTNSQLLEDVYTMNDFILGEVEPERNEPQRALRPQAEVTGKEVPIPYLVTEYNGHMYPTKATDSEHRLAEQALRHLEVIDAAFGDPNISGCVGWCAWDYNTHADFGSGDRICHHGVMDMFREPKFAAYAYSSQCEPQDGIILKPATYWARGERSIGGVLPLLIMTNCDFVELQYGETTSQLGYPARDRFPNLPHPPIIFETRDFGAQQLGMWGTDWQSGTIRGFLNNEHVATFNLVRNPLPTSLDVIPDAGVISERDAVRVMIRALDQVGNKLPYLLDPVKVSIDGPARILGPRILPLRAGSTGLWLQSTGVGKINLYVRHDRFAPVERTITVQQT